MIDNDVQQKLMDFLISEGWHIGDGMGDICSGHDDEAMEKSIKILQRLCEDLFAE